MAGDKVRDCLGIVLVGAALALLLRPFQNAPFIDDFVFAWPVEELLRHGRLGNPEYAVGILVVQVLWGALFCLPLGFSFTALRLSTFVLALSALCSVYLTLRELGVSRRDSLLGAAALGVYPVFFILSFTFMTDVPFVAVMVWASYAFVRGVRARQSGWLVLAAVLAGLSLGVRPVGGALPGAMLMTLLLHTRGWGLRKGRFLLALVPVAFFGLLLYWYWFLGGTLYSADMSQAVDGPNGRLQAIKYAIPYLPHFLLSSLGFAAGAVGVAVLPLTLACLDRKTLLRALVVFPVLAGVIWVGCAVDEIDYCLPLTSDQTWALDELGASSALVPGHKSIPPAVCAWLTSNDWLNGVRARVSSLVPGSRALPPVRDWVYWAAMLIGCWSFSVVLAAQWRRAGPGEAWRWWVILLDLALVILLCRFYPRHRFHLLPRILPILLLLLLAAVLAGQWLWPEPGKAFLFWLVLGDLFLIALLYLFYDRYGLVLVPPVIILLLAGRQQASPRPAESPAPSGSGAEGVAPRPRLWAGVAVVLLAAYGAFSIVGTRDHLAYNGALWEAVEELHQMGVPDAQIDGGYMVNGWLQYSHPENAYRDAKGEILIPWVNADDSVGRYKISNSSFKGYKVLKRIPYRRWQGPSGAVYVLTRE